jgi:hypothetical protein
MESLPLEALEIDLGVPAIVIMQFYPFFSACRARKDLPAREIHIHDRFSGFGEERIHKAGDKKLNALTGLFHFRSCLKV